MLSSRSGNKVLAFLCLVFLLNLASATFAQLVQAQKPSDSDALELPDRRKGGGGRDGKRCLAENKQLVALMPKSSLGEYYLAGTAATQPQLFFYVPPLVQPTEVELVLRDPNDELVYETRWQLPTRGGILSLNLPASGKANLRQSGGDYHWYFSLICNPQERAKDIVVEGLIRRVSLQPSLTQKLDRATPLEKVKLYQEAELWTERLTVLAELKRSQSNDPALLELWGQLLDSAELDVQ